MLLLSDMKYGFRLMLKSPGFTLISVLALAIGIGAVTTMFSVINGAIWRGLPYEEPEEIVFIKRYNSQMQPWDTAIPVHDFIDMRERQQSFEDIVGYFGGTVNVSYKGNPQRFSGSRISAGFLEVLGVRPLLGRSFTAVEDEPGAPPSLLLSYGIWQSHYSGDPNVVGETVLVNGQIGTIVGVMPKGFRFPVRDEVWITLGSAVNWTQLKRGQGWSLNVTGRLKDGVSIDQAEAEMTNFMLEFAREYPQLNEDYKIAAVTPYTREVSGPQTVRMMYFMLGMGVFVLLLACMNVANLLLARSALRTKELAIRSSLGASRFRLIAQLVTESVVLAIVGALGGLVIAQWATTKLMSYAETMNMPFWFSFDLNLKILGIVTVVTLLTGLLAGLIPAIKASRVSVNEILKDDTRTGSSLHLGLFSKMLVIFQVALSFVLLVLTGLMTRSVQNIADTDLHFDTSTVFTARMGLFEGAYPESEDRHKFYKQLRDNLSVRPEVQSATLYSRYRWTLMGIDWGRVGREGETYNTFEDRILATSENIFPDYFKTMGVTLLAGREFNEFDTPDNTPVAVINKALADALFPSEDPIGKRFKREPWPQERATADTEEELDLPWLTVVGVAPDMAPQGVGNQTDAQNRAYYLPINEENTPMFMTVAATGMGDPLMLTEVVRTEVAKLDPNLPLYSVGTPAMIIREDNAGNVIIANIFKIFGATAIFLAAIGIYGVMSFSVNQRTQEFGIRAALGATARHIVGNVLRGGVLQLAIGLSLGVLGAYLFSRLIQNMLYDVSNIDPFTYAVVIAVSTLVAVSACFLPARRASRIHPAQALRYE